MTDQRITELRSDDKIRADLRIKPADGHNALLRYDHARERLAWDVEPLLAEVARLRGVVQAVESLLDEHERSPYMFASVHSRFRAALAAAEGLPVPTDSEEPAVPEPVECCASGRCEVCSPGYRW